jgi:hypothetical protein
LHCKFDEKKKRHDGEQETDTEREEFDDEEKEG